MLPTNCLKVEINGLAYRARRAYHPMSDAVKTKTSPLYIPAKIANIIHLQCTNARIARIASGVHTERQKAGSAALGLSCGACFEALACVSASAGARTTILYVQISPGYIPIYYIVCADISLG